MRVYTLKKKEMTEVIITDDVSSVWDLVISEGFQIFSIMDL